jgi:hypothetical protein
MPIGFPFESNSTNTPAATSADESERTPCRPNAIWSTSASGLPAESDTGMFGGNSNWRGPIWMPVNALLIRALHYYAYYGDNFKIECPTGSGKPHDLDYDRLRRHRAGRPIRPQPSQSGVGYRAILSRHHGRSPRNFGIGRSAPLTSNCEFDVDTVYLLIPSIYPCAAKPGVPQCCDFLSFCSLGA